MLLAEFKDSSKKYGIKNIECGLEGNRLVVAQTLGGGIRGLGYDKEAKSLWLCLDQMFPATVKENKQWNANTILTAKSELPGVKIETVGEITKIVIASDHPIVALARLIGKENCVTLPGEYNNWEVNGAFKFNTETGELKNNLNWDGSRTEVKIAIMDVTADWADGKWQVGAKQILSVDLKK